MNPMLKISEEGLALIKSSESFKPNLYNCPAGHCTIGYGHLVHFGRCGEGYPAKGLTKERALILEAPFKDGLTEQQASELLRRDLKQYETTVHTLVKVDLDQSEYDALVDFEYNTGALGKSTLLKLLNAGDYDGAAAEFDKWVKANGQRLAGLVTRRDAEEALFRRDLPREPLNT